MNRASTLTALLFVAALFPAVAHASRLSLLSFGYEYVPGAELRLTGVEDEELTVAAATSTVKFAIPVLVDGTKKMFLNFFTLRQINQTYDRIGANENVFRPDRRQSR